MRYCIVLAKQSAQLVHLSRPRKASREPRNPQCQVAAGLDKERGGWERQERHGLALAEREIQSALQDLVAQFSKSFLDLAVIVAGLELIEKVLDHVGAVAGDLAN